MRIAGKLGILIAVMVLFAPPSYANYCVPPKPPAKPAPPDEPCPACEPKECKKCTASPVFLSLGTYTRDDTDLTIRTTGFGITVARYYDSGRAVDGPMGIGWTSSLTSRVHDAVYATSGTTYQRKAYVVMPHGAIYEFTRNSSTGAFTPPIGRRDTLVQNGDGTFDMTLGNSRTVLHFNVDGTLSWMKDEYNNAINYTYDGNGRIQRVADGAGSGRYVDITWNTATGRIASVTDSAGRTVRYTYDGAGNLETVANAVTPVGEHSTRYSYVAGRFGPVLSRVEDRWNRLITRIDWDSLSKVKSYTEGEFNDALPTASAGEKYTYTYQSGSSTRRDHSLGFKTFSYAAATGLKMNELVTYDSSGQVTRVIEPAVGTTDYTYDGSGRILTEAVYGGSSQSVLWTYTYDPAFPDKVTSRKSDRPDLWQGTRYEYYPPGSTAPGALKTIYRIRTDGVTEDGESGYVYDVRGRLTSAIGVSDSPSSNYTYNAAGDLITVKRGNDTPVHFEYDGLGRMTKHIDEMGMATTFTYDAADRIVTTTLPKPTATSTLNFTTTHTYDEYHPASQLTFAITTDPNGRVTKQGYDALGNLGTSIDALQHETTYAYQYNLLKSISDANGNVTTYAYDANRQLASTTLPDGAIETYTRSVNGRLIAVTDRRGIQLIYAYDAVGRVVSAVYRDPLWPPGQSNGVSYTYQGQKLTAVTDQLGPVMRSYQFTYDVRFRVKTEGYSGETTIEYAYLAEVGGPSQLMKSYTLRPASGPDRVSTVYYTYDLMNRVETVSFDLSFPDATISYNARGQYQRIEFGNGMLRDFSYDDQGRLTAISTTHPTAGTIASFTYGYDYNWTTSTNTMLGQRTSMASGTDTRKYRYDAAYQLIEEGPPFGAYTRWDYDAIGNRTLQTSNFNPTRSYEYYKNGTNTANSSRLRKAGTDPIVTYDANGNQLNSATWDVLNRLVQHGTTTFEYDWRSRRTKRQNAKYTYFGESVARVRDAAAGVLDDFIFGPGIDEPLLRKDASGAKSYYLVDGLDSVVAVVNAAGTVTEGRIYDAWGSTTSPGTFGYTGREVGAGVLLYYRARYYDVSVGRFISEDPERFGQGANFYTYVRNDPINSTDPSGQQAKLSCTTGLWQPAGAVAKAGSSYGKWSLAKEVELGLPIVIPGGTPPAYGWGTPEGAADMLGLGWCMCVYKLTGSVRRVDIYFRFKRSVWCNPCAFSKTETRLDYGGVKYEDQDSIFSYPSPIKVIGPVPCMFCKPEIYQ